MLDYALDLQGTLNGLLFIITKRRGRERERKERERENELTLE